MANENTIELVIRAKELASQAIKALTQAMGEIPAKEAEVNTKLKTLKTEANQFVAKLTNDRIKLAEYEKDQKLKQLYEYYKQGLISTQQYQTAFKAAISQAHESAAEPSFFSKLKGNWLAVTGAIIGAWALVSKAIDYIKLGAAAQQAETSFRQVAASYGENADKLLAKMKEASQGTIDDSNMMQRAVKGLQQGLSGDQIVKVLEISRTAARVAGTDIEAAFDGMTNAIANQQLRALKQYGIMIDLNDVFEKYAQKIGLSKDMLTEYDQTQAIYNAVVEEGTRQAEAFGNIQMDASEKIQVAKSALQDLKEQIGEGLIKAVEIATAGFYKLLESIFYVSGGYYKVAAVIESFLGNSKEAAVANKMAALFFEEANKQAEKASLLWSKATGELDNAASKEKENAEAIAKTRRDAVNDTTHAASIEKKANEEKAKSYVEASKKINDSIKSSEDRIRSLTKAIEDSDKKIAQISRDIDKDISDIESKGEDLAKTNPFELWQKARQKMSDAGSKALEGDLDAAESLFQDARSMFKDLGANTEYARDAANGLKTVKEELIALEEQRDLAAQASLDTEIQNIQTLIAKAEELKQSLSNIPLKVDSSELDSVIQKYKDLDGSEIRVKVIQEKVGGGGIEPEAMSGGGLLSGIDTGRDYIPVWARGGEYFHPPESVKYYGLRFMEAVRTRSFPKPLADLLNGMAANLGSRFGAQKFPLNMAEGGPVPSIGSYDLNLNIGGERVVLKGDDFNVKKLITILRREQKQRGN